MAYHALLHQTGPKTMDRLPGISLSPQQIFFIVAGQNMDSEFEYAGILTNSTDFTDM